MTEKKPRSKTYRNIEKVEQDLVQRVKSGWLDELKVEHSDAKKLFLNIDYGDARQTNEQIDKYLRLEDEMGQYSGVAMIYIDDPETKLGLRTACRELISIENVLDEKRASFIREFDKIADIKEISFTDIAYDRKNIASFRRLKEEAETLQEYANRLGYQQGSIRLRNYAATIENTIGELEKEPILHPEKKIFEERQRYKSELNGLTGQYEVLATEITKAIEEGQSDLKIWQNFRDRCVHLRDAYDDLDHKKGFTEASGLETTCYKNITRLSARRKKRIGMKFAGILSGVLIFAFIWDGVAKVAEGWPYYRDRIGYFSKKDAEESPDTGTNIETRNYVVKATVEKIEETEKIEEIKEIQELEGTTIEYGSLDAKKDSVIPYSVEFYTQRNPDFRYFIYVDKLNNETRTYENTSEGLEEIFRFESTDGLRKGPKKKTDDQKTPEGLYHIVKNWEDGGPLYGAASISLDYPNEEDLKIGNTGKGILICGTDIKKRQQNIREGYDCTNGSIVLLNEDMIQLYEKIVPYKDKTLILIENPIRPLVREDPEVLG